MRKVTRNVLSLLVVGAGLASLLATSSPPIPTFGLLTLNNFPQADYSYGVSPAYACKGETAQLYWDSYGNNGWNLSASSPQSFSPPLTNRSVEARGKLDVTVVGDAELTLAARGGDSLDGYLAVKLLPEAVCTGFAFPLIGLYEGRLEQTFPESETLSRQLRLAYTEDVYGFEAPGLRIVIAQEVTSVYNDTASCNLEPVNARIACERRAEDGSSFSLLATITATGLEGRYSGTRIDAGSAVSFEGKLNFAKQPATPQTEQP